MPSLPFELERQIFEIAALQDTNHRNRVQLILVAKRIYEWIRPILYRVAVTQETHGGELTIRNWGTTRITDVAPFVRHLLIDSESHAFELLSTFHNVENLAIWPGHGISTDILEKINNLPLRMLSVVLAHLSLDKTIGHCPAFRNTTHLEIISMEGTTWNDFKPLVEFPNLTHLCFDTLVVMEGDVIPSLLEHCPSLQAVIYQLFRSFIVKTDDPRFLMLLEYMDYKAFIEEWIKSANGQIGLWELADVIIRARKDKLFKDNSFIFTRKTWMNNLNEDGKRWYKEWSR